MALYSLVFKSFYYAYIVAGNRVMKILNCHLIPVIFYACMAMPRRYQIENLKEWTKIVVG